MAIGIAIVTLANISTAAMVLILREPSLSRTGLLAFGLGSWRGNQGFRRYPRTGKLLSTTLLHLRNSIKTIDGAMMAFPSETLKTAGKRYQRNEMQSVVIDYRGETSCYNNITQEKAQPDDWTVTLLFQSQCTSMSRQDNNFAQMHGMV
jgi:hypothetical protein